MTELASRGCKAGAKAVEAARSDELLAEIPGWSREGAALCCTFRFADYHRTMAFVNAVAWIAHTEDHHPELSVGYSTCGVRFTTHDAGGLTENDFICAAKVSALGAS